MNFDLVELLTHPAFMLLIILGLDLIFGDPVYRFHPVKMIGSLISFYETVLRRSGLNGKFGGVLLSLLVILSTLLFNMGIFKFLENLNLPRKVLILIRLTILETRLKIGIFIL